MGKFLGKSLNSSYRKIEKTKTWVWWQFIWSTIYYPFCVHVSFTSRVADPIIAHLTMYFGIVSLYKKISLLKFDIWHLSYEPNFQKCENLTSRWKIVTSNQLGSVLWIHRFFIYPTTAHWLHIFVTIIWAIPKWVNKKRVKNISNFCVV